MRRGFNISFCECPDCHREFPIPRIKGRSRERNHRKDIYCPFCKKKVTMTEHRFNDFNRNGLGELL